ncbi:MAG: hypothetical protein KDA87_26825, partial [Planctomycetales bacterium]|nr:hypothetical protein [Planctomycetales bacterium]
RRSTLVSTYGETQQVVVDIKPGFVGALHVVVSATDGISRTETEFSLTVTDSTLPSGDPPRISTGDLGLSLTDSQRSSFGDVSRTELSRALVEAISFPGLHSSIQQRVNEELAKLPEVSGEENWGNKISKRVWGVTIEGNHGLWKRWQVNNFRIEHLTIGGQLVGDYALVSVNVNVIADFSVEIQSWSWAQKLASYSPSGQIVFYTQLSFVVDLAVEDQAWDRLSAALSVSQPRINTAIPVIRSSDRAARTAGAFLTLAVGSPFGQAALTALGAPIANQIGRLRGEIDARYDAENDDLVAEGHVFFGDAQVAAIEKRLPLIFARKESSGPHLVNPRHYAGDAVYYINGALTNWETAQSEAVLLSDQLQRPVMLIYNGTNGLSDVTEVLRDYAWNINEASQNDTIPFLLAALREDAANGRRSSIVTHSQGNMILRNALEIMRATGGQEWIEQSLAWVATGSPIRGNESLTLAMFTNLMNASDPISLLQQGNVRIEQFTREQHDFDDYAEQLDVSMLIDG